MKKQKFHVLAYNWQPGNKQEIEEALSDDFRITYENDPGTFKLKLGMENQDMLILAIEAEDDPAMALFREIRVGMPATPVIVACGSGHPELIAAVMREGVSACIEAPWQSERIRHVMEKIVAANSHINELAYLRRTQDAAYRFDDVVAETPNFRTIVDNLRKFAAYDSTMLFIGEIGTGKSFLAGTVHFNSPRRAKPFVKINCTNIAEHMLESELFGHEAGAFPGADKQRIGRLEQANGGTVFLDEIAELPLGLQGKLLRLLEEKAFERLAGNRTIYVDVRVIAATHRNLGALIASGAFREDLFYRLNVLPVQLPPLKERPDCVAPLAHKLLTAISTRVCKPIHGFTDEALRLICDYNWPGNILQLGNVIERAVILEEGEYISPSSLEGVDGFAPYDPVNAPTIPELADSECALLLRALKESNWVQKRAAVKLGVSARVINYKIKKYGITHEHWRKQKPKASAKRRNRKATLEELVEAGQVGAVQPKSRAAQQRPTARKTTVKRRSAANKRSASANRNAQATPERNDTTTPGEE